MNLNQILKRVYSLKSDVKGLTLKNNDRDKKIKKTKRKKRVLLLISILKKIKMKFNIKILKYNIISKFIIIKKNLLHFL